MPLDMIGDQIDMRQAYIIGLKFQDILHKFDIFSFYHYSLLDFFVQQFLLMPF